VNTRGKSDNTSKDFIEYCIFPKKAGAEEIPAKEKKLQQVISTQFSCRGILGHGRILWSWRNPSRRKKMLEKDNRELRQRVLLLGGGCVHQ